MKIRPLSVVLGLFLACAAVVPSCAAQPPAAAAADTQKQLDALRAQVNAMQKDLDEIKALLAPLRARQAPPPGSIALDLGDRPIRGAPTAKLTLVELTDYQ
jgi:protein-disulfide isomerase